MFYPLNIVHLKGNLSTAISPTVPQTPEIIISSFPSSDNLSCLLIAFENSLDPDQARQFVWPDLGPNLFGTLMEFLKEQQQQYFE